MRYFASVGANNKALNIFRFDRGETGMIEDYWTPNGWKKDSDAEIARYLVLGEGDFVEISEEVARQMYPQVFDDVAKSIGNYEVQKAEGDKRYTLGAMYIPDRLDAHNEWTDAEELQRAVWDYVRSNDRRIRLQHNRDIVAGEWVEVMSFPYELSVPITTLTGIMVNHTYPANTVFLGVIWEEWAWEKIQLGEILGYSIGGRAERLYVDMEKNDPTATDVHVDTIMNPKKKKKVTDETK